MHRCTQLSMDAQSHAQCQCLARMHRQAAGRPAVENHRNRTLVCVIVYDVEDDLDARGMQGLHQLLELAAGGKGATAVRREARHRRKEVDVRIAPHVHHVILQQTAPVQMHNGSISVLRFLK